MIDNKKELKKINSKAIKDEVVKDIVAINHGRAGDAQIRPNLAIILLESNNQEMKFVTKMEKEAKKVGIDTHTYRCPEGTEEEELFAMIKCLNDDRLIDGIYLQLPLPDSFDKKSLIDSISFSKELGIDYENGIELSNLSMANIFKSVLDNLKKHQENRK